MNVAARPVATARAVAAAARGTGIATCTLARLPGVGHGTANADSCGSGFRRDDPLHRRLRTLSPRLLAYRDDLLPRTRWRACRATVLPPDARLCTDVCYDRGYAAVRVRQLRTDVRAVRQHLSDLCRELRAHR